MNTPLHSAFLQTVFKSFCLLALWPCLVVADYYTEYVWYRVDEVENRVILSVETLWDREAVDAYIGQAKALKREGKYHTYNYRDGGVDKIRKVAEVNGHTIVTHLIIRHPRGHGQGGAVPNVDVTLFVDDVIRAEIPLGYHHGLELAIPRVEVQVNGPVPIVRAEVRPQGFPADSGKTKTIRIECTTPDDTLESADILRVGYEMQAQDLLDHLEGLSSEHSRHRLLTEYEMKTLEKAAKWGSSSAMKSLFRLRHFKNNLRYGDPYVLLRVFRGFLEYADPADIETSFPDHAETLARLEMLAAPGPFDGGAFMEKYGIRDEDLTDAYGVWRLAEEASRPGRFGEPDPTLIFHLVVRGKEVPFEWEFATEKIYAKWKTGEPFEFNICDYVSSSMGSSMCQERRRIKEERARGQVQENMRSRLPPAQRHLVQSAFQSAQTYYDLKARHEEGHGGALSWRNVHIRNSVQGRMRAYTDWIEKRLSPGMPTPALDQAKIEREMDEMFSLLKASIDAFPELAEDIDVTVEGVEETQASWNNFRNIHHKLLSVLGSDEFARQWVAWLSRERTRDMYSTQQAVSGHGFVK